MLSKGKRRPIKAFLSLRAQQQRMVNIFFDHFYNHVIFYNAESRKKVSVPYNFNTLEGWSRLFRETRLQEERVIHLGVDVPLALEYHTLHVLRR